MTLPSHSSSPAADRKCVQNGLAGAADSVRPNVARSSSLAANLHVPVSHTTPPAAPECVVLMLVLAWFDQPASIRSAKHVLADQGAQPFRASSMDARVLARTYLCVRMQRMPGRATAGSLEGPRVQRLVYIFSFNTRASASHSRTNYTRAARAPDDHVSRRKRGLASAGASHSDSAR